MTLHLEPVHRPLLEDQCLLVTGGAGLVGSRLVDRLAGVNEVRVLGNLSSGTQEWIDDQATLIGGDIRDPDSVANAARDVDKIFIRPRMSVSSSRSHSHAPLTILMRTVDSVDLIVFQ